MPGEVGVRVTGSTSGGVGVGRSAREEQEQRDRNHHDQNHEEGAVTKPHVPHGVTVAVDQCRRRDTATYARPARSRRQIQSLGVFVVGA